MSDEQIPQDNHATDAPSDGDKPAYNLFLKSKDVTAAPGEDFEIQPGFTRRKPGSFGEQIIMEVIRKRDGKTFDFAIGVGSVNHRILAKRWGEERMWRGTLRLQSQQGARSPFVAIVTDGDVPF
jgi:hypothetical protein